MARMERPELTLQILLTIGIAVGAVALFAWNRVRADVVALIVMATVILTGLVTPQQGTSGFSNEATATVALMMVLAAGLARTGFIDRLGVWIGRLSGDSEIRFLIVLLAFTLPASAVINNTPVVIVLLPVVLGFARRTGIPSSRLLMPMSFGSQLGGTLTLIGTSTNLLVASLVVDLGLPRFGLFTITPPAAVLAAIGVAYLLTAGRWLAPRRKAPGSLINRYELRDYLTAVVVAPGSPVAGRMLSETRIGEQLGMQIVAIRRGDTRIPLPVGSTRIEAGDLLVVEGKVADIANLEKSTGLRIAGTRPEIFEESEEPDLAEIIVPPRSHVIGSSLRDLGFRARYGLNVLALQRHGSPIHAALGMIPLEAGDILLVQGPTETLQTLHRGGEFSLLGALELPARRVERQPIAVGIVAAVVLFAAFDLLTIMVSALVGAVAMVLTGCIRPDEAYGDVDWMVIVLLGGVIPLGLAMQNSGAAAFIAGSLVNVAAPLGLYGTLAAFYLLTSLLTEIISNNAAAVVLTPVAVALAASLGVSPMPFVVATMLAASNSFMTPIGYQTNTFIYGPGGYTFMDFVRVGTPLNLLLALAATIIIPLTFPF
jgi:di/tricarboxylate transporter